MLRGYVRAFKTSTHLDDVWEQREVAARNDRRLEVIPVEVQLTRA